jgi:hypothetical protein
MPGVSRRDNATTSLPGDLRYFPTGTFLTPSIPIPPPVLGPLEPGVGIPAGTARSIPRDFSSARS